MLRFDPTLLDRADKAEDCARDLFASLEKTRRSVFDKILEGFHRNDISEAHLKGSSGYGYHDYGRKGLDDVFAFAMDSPSAMARPQFVSGTHAIAASLIALLKGGDTMVCPQGRPYQSLLPTLILLSRIGVKIVTEETEWKREASRAGSSLLVFLQRSPGYENRKRLSWKIFQELIEQMKEDYSQCLILIDNCYGEFVHEQEPTAFGADLLCGSLIKNPGGGLALTGGYVAGREDLVDAVAERIFAPGLGRQMGASEGQLRSLYQGLFSAPFVVCESLKGAIFAAFFFQSLGFEVDPRPEEERNDIVQTIRLESKERLSVFAQAVQEAGPIDWKAKPEPSLLPGYRDEVVTAAGTFITGASLELSCDAPMSPPYSVYLQGGLSFDHSRHGSILAAQRMMESHLLP
jgi:cystathionine beta-lyase family protein involved in aluminum resistance